MTVGEAVVTRGVIAVPTNVVTTAVVALRVAGMEEIGTAESAVAEEAAVLQRGWRGALLEAILTIDMVVAELCQVIFRGR